MIGKHRDYNEILRELDVRGLGYEKWNTLDLDKDLSDEEILKFYDNEVDKIMKRFNFKTNDIIQLTPDNPKNNTLREKFLSEHTHSEKEVRYFIDGAACFYIPLPEREEVLRMECAKGHLLVVPELTKHWFDMGPNPYFKCIRFFGIEDGWVADYTKDTISNRFPLYDN